jgi:hypothetical protein
MPDVQLQFLKKMCQVRRVSAGMEPRAIMPWTCKPWFPDSSLRRPAPSVNTSTRGWLMPPFRLMNWPSGSEQSLHLVSRRGAGSDRAGRYPPAAYRRPGPILQKEVGAPQGYNEFLEAIADPKHERQKELREWSGKDSICCISTDINHALAQFSPRKSTRRKSAESAITE